MSKPLAQSRGEVRPRGRQLRLLRGRGPVASFRTSCWTSRAAARPCPLRAGRPAAGHHAVNYPYYQVRASPPPTWFSATPILLKHARQLPAVRPCHRADLPGRRAPAKALTSTSSSATNRSPRSSPTPRAGRLLDRQRAGRLGRCRGGRPEPEEVRRWNSGGSDPFIVLDSEDLDATVKAAVSGRMGNAGRPARPQSGSSSSRTSTRPSWRVHRQMSAVKPGRPTAGRHTVRPALLAGRRRRPHRADQDAVDKGATLRTGGHHVGRPRAPSSSPRCSPT